MQQNYRMFVNKIGLGYCGLYFEWTYNKVYIDISMPGYITEILQIFQHMPPKAPQWVTLTYGKTVQFAKKRPPDLHQLDKQGTNHI